jgi:hypothetical protein
MSKKNTPSLMPIELPAGVTPVVGSEILIMKQLPSGTLLKVDSVRITQINRDGSYAFDKEVTLPPGPYVFCVEGADNKVN